jgi:small subunit ribosomal protein S1
MALTIPALCGKLPKGIQGSNYQGMAEENANATDQAAEGQLEEQYFKTLQGLEEGQMISGTVVQISSDNVFVDVGYKSEGKIPIGEFRVIPAVGEQVQVVLVRKESRDGSIAVSKARADEKIFWRNLRKAHAEKLPIEGKITAQVKGGYNVDLGSGVSGFLPLSKTDVYRVNNVEEYIGLQSKFALERLFSNGKVNIVLSRRAWLEEEYKRRREEFFSKTQIGDEVEGRVKSFTSFGAFIDLGGFDGLLHINDMSWGHVNTPKDKVTLGDTIHLKVINLDPENQRINLSLKHFTEDPWNSFEEKFQSGDVVRGKVTKLTDFGAFIELSEGIEGLAHISEFSWVKRVRHPREVLHVGDAVDVKVLDYDVTQGKVSLGLKQVHANPWSDIDDRFPVGMRIKRTVKNLAPFGAFFEVEEGIDGLLHLDDFSWTKHYKAPGELLKEGDEVEVMVIGIDKETQRIRLGLKQLDEDPWKSLQKAFPRGSVIEGVVTRSADFGVFVKVQGDIEGLVATKSLYDSRNETLEDVMATFKEGAVVKVVVLEVNPSRQKLGLSRVDLMRRVHDEEMSKYLHSEESSDKVTLGDLLKDKLSDS